MCLTSTRDSNALLDVHNIQLRDDATWRRLAKERPLVICSTFKGCEVTFAKKVFEYQNIVGCSPLMDFDYVDMPISVVTDIMHCK